MLRAISSDFSSPKYGRQVITVSIVNQSQHVLGPAVQVSFSILTPEA